MASVYAVPQLFYDMIARLVPGAIIIQCAVLVQCGPTRFLEHFRDLGQTLAEQSFAFSVVCIVMIGVACYGVAMYCMGLWALFSRVSKLESVVFPKSGRDKWQRIAVICTAGYRQSMNRPVQDLDVASGEELSLAVVYDAVRLASSEAGARLAKVRAECHMCAVIVTGLTVLFLWNLGAAMTDATAARVVLAFVFLIGIAAFRAMMCDLEERFMTGLANSWYLLGLPKSLPANG